MPARRKSHTADLVFVDPPFLCMLKNVRYGLVVILQRQRPTAFFQYSIIQDKCLKSCFRIRQCHGICLALRTVYISAARKNDHRRPRREIGKFPAYLLDISRHMYIALLVEHDLFDFHLCLLKAISFRHPSAVRSPRATTNPRRSYRTFAQTQH